MLSVMHIIVLQQPNCNRSVVAVYWPIAIHTMGGGLIEPGCLVHATSSGLLH